MTKDDVDKIARAIRLISHGEDHPAGLEMVAMAISGDNGDHISLAESINGCGMGLSEIANALSRIADAMEARK